MGCDAPESDRGASAPSSILTGSAAGRDAETVPGDWDDLEAAVRVGMDSIDAVIAGSRRKGPDAMTFDLKTIRNETGVLEAEQTPRGIRLRASIGRFGDPQREHRLIRAVADRLHQLHGVEFAPIR